ncbi:MAG: zinc-binding protein [Clostridium paraputrificum]
MDVQKEYERIKALFDGADESQLNLIDGAIWEAARIRVELNTLHEIVKESGLIKVHPQNPALQKELPVSKLIVKARANYLNYISKLSNLLGKNIDDEDDDLSDYE